MIADNDDVVAPHNHRYECLGLDGLRGLVDEHRFELEVGEPAVARTHACHANHVRAPQHALLQRPNKRLVPLFVLLGQFALLVLQVVQLERLHRDRNVQVHDLMRQRQMLDGASYFFPRL